MVRTWISGGVIAAAGAAMTGFPVYAQKPDVVIVHAADFSSVASAMMKEYHTGVQLYFARVNAQGGVQGQKLVLRKMDDHFEPDITEAHTKVALSDPQVMAFIGPRGTQNIMRMLPLAQKAHTAVVAPAIGSSIVWDPKYTVSFPLRATYAQEAKVMANFSTSYGNHVGLLVTNDAYGKDMHAAVSRFLQEANTQAKMSVVAFDRKNNDFTTQVKAMQAANPNTVLMFCSARACGEFLKEWERTRRPGVQASMFITNSALDLSVLANNQHAQGVRLDTLVGTQVVPNPRVNFGNGYFEFSQAFTKANTAVSFAALEGWAAAVGLVDALRRAPQPLTREGVVKVLAATNVELGPRFRVDFTHKEPSHAPPVDIFRIHPLTKRIS